MWLLHFLPDSFILFIVHGILLAGIVLFIVGLVAKKIPPIANYGVIIGVVSFILLLTGAYLEGGYGTEKVWRDKVAVLEKKVTASEEESKAANLLTEIKVLKEYEIIHDTQYVIKTQIKEVEKLIDAECVVNPVAITILNEAATNTKGAIK
jgi:hypothetical protein